MRERGKAQAFSHYLLRIDPLRRVGRLQRGFRGGTMEHTPVDRVAQLEDQVSRLTSLVEGLQAERMAVSTAASENGSRSPRSRRDLLKLAGAAAAGAAGVALAGRSVKDAYAINTDTNFVANGNTSGIGFSTIPGNFATGVYTTGSNLGILAQGAIA